jgi:hypothetical protein
MKSSKKKEAISLKNYPKCHLNGGTLFFIHTNNLFFNGKSHQQPKTTNRYKPQLKRPKLPGTNYQNLNILTFYKP